MKKALELAERGAGLVSPNPMVGALLVRDGRIVGEGYHRYDLLKHAESYAIEMAGERARGATLYCSLEPCCHHGRTPPCTDALIRAGIARAVIAIEDPDPRVRGRGIDQLREAGVEIEVGLCAAEALRLDEGYFKYSRTGLPFVHGVVEWPEGRPDLFYGWSPSRELIEAATRTDALLLGRRPESNRLFLDASLGRERHRPLIIVGTYADLQDSGSLSLAGEDAAGVRPVLLSAEPLTDKLRSSVLVQVEPRFDSLLELLARMRALNLFVLPGALLSGASPGINDMDKVTFLAQRATRVGEDGMQAFFGGGAAAWHAGEYTEYTGYPRRGGEA